MYNLHIETLFCKEIRHDFTVNINKFVGDGVCLRSPYKY